MKKVISLALVLLISQMTFAGGNSSVEEKNQVKKKVQLGTSFKFDGSKLHGKYQSSMNTSATVENDKLLEDLLRGRTQFEDRLEEETQRN
ncbi:MAG: hypothetical protein ACXVCY_02715 [Pseudobdellovibrionaceae bacterium]